MAPGASPFNVADRTYVLVRVGLLGLVGTLIAGVSWLRYVAGCGDSQHLRSFSAYYYTTAGPLLVATLGAAGFLLVVFRPKSDLENALLNLAGLLAPAVAFVPAEFPGRSACVTVAAAPYAPGLGYNPSLLAYLVAATGGWLLTFTALGRILGTAEGGAEPPPRIARVAHWVGFVVSLGFLAMIAVLPAALPEHFAWVHYSAAVVMFVCIAVVVLLNTGLGRRLYSAGLPGGQDLPGVAPWVGRVNGLLGLAMLGGLALGPVRLLTGEPSLYVIELTILVVFATYWALQTLLPAFRTTND